MASKDLGSSPRAPIPQGLGLPWDGWASTAGRDLSGEREEGKLWDFSRKGQPTLTHIATFLGAAGVFVHQISSGKGRHGQQTLGGITKEINVLPSLQKICSKGIGGEGKGVVSNGEWQQVPKTLGKNNLLA